MKSKLTLLIALTLCGFLTRAQYVVNGNAADLGNGVYQMTLGISGGVQQASIYDSATIDLSQPFMMQCEMNFGSITTGYGGDGMTFVLQREGINALHGGGGYLGLANYTQPHYPLTPCIFIEFDTFDNIPNNFPDLWEDHVAIGQNGDFYSTPLAGPVPANAAGEIEDGLWHHVQVTWNPAQQLFEMVFDSTTTLSMNVDIINTIFSGTPSGVYWGFSAGSANAINDQLIRNIQFNITTGIKENPALQGVNLYPVPASDHITVSSLKSMLKEISIYDVAGKLALSLSPGSLSQKISLNDFLPGYYFAKIKNEEGTLFQKFIIIR